MSISIRDALEAIAIISAMIAVIAIPNPAEAAEPGSLLDPWAQARCPPYMDASFPARDY